MLLPALVLLVGRNQEDSYGQICQMKGDGELCTCLCVLIKGGLEFVSTGCTCNMLVEIVNRNCVSMHLQSGFQSKSEKPRVILKLWRQENPKQYIIEVYLSTRKRSNQIVNSVCLALLWKNKPLKPFQRIFKIHFLPHSLHPSLSPCQCQSPSPSYCVGGPRSG
jgi:hypothetical protein